MTADRRHASGLDDTVLARRTATLDPDLGSARAARQLLTTTLEATGRQQWADAGALALSEVVTNAVLHAHTAIQLVIEVDQSLLRVEVEDGNPTPPMQRDHDTSTTTGRGMALVAAVTTECGVHSLGGRGKVVWFTLADSTAETEGAGPSGPDIDDLLDGWDVDGGWDASSLAPDTVEVVLEQMPLTLWQAARQHHNAILRELVLHQAAHGDGDVNHALADTARGLISAAVLEAAAAAGQSVGAANLLIAVPRDVGAAFGALKHALDTAEQLACTGRMLIRAGLPEIVAVRDWACDQVLEQLAGSAPSPWPGIAQRHFETVAALAPSTAWDDEYVRAAERNIVAADDTNRIVAVSHPLATLLGWKVGDLVGRRVVTLIPERLREAHVAGFTRHLLTGETHLLGTETMLPVLRADGSELQCRLLIEHAPIGIGRSLFVAWIDPVA